MRDKCKNCPVKDSECKGQTTEYYCNVVDPADPLYNPAYLEMFKFEVIPITGKIYNYGKAIVTHLINGLKKAPEHVRNYRLSICNQCDRLNVSRECIECGCPVDTKVEFDSEACPLKKWLPYGSISGCSSCDS